jgi:hypothetical protein
MSNGYDARAARRDESISRWSRGAPHWADYGDAVGATPSSKPCWIAE